MQPQDLLAQANLQDNYINLCKKCEANWKARKGMEEYVPWHDQSLARELNKFFQGRARVIIMNPNADGGMPHTRALNLICIPANYPTAGLESLLEHEYLHIDQRRNFDKWRKRLLEEGWYPDGEVPEDIQARCRINPDTLVCRWPAWEGRWIPCPIFVREDRPSLKDIDVRWWDMQEERMLSFPPSSYTKRYGEVSKSEMEHPFELWAYN